MCFGLVTASWRACLLKFEQESEHARTWQMSVLSLAGQVSSIESSQRSSAEIAQSNNAACARNLMAAISKR